MNCKKNNIKYLRPLIVAIVAIPILGVIFDIGIRFKLPILIKMENISEFSLALIQIQATIATLMLSIIGILSGVLSDQYMGVSVSYYFLEIKPRPLTHKNIIYAEFILLVLSLIGYVFLLYNFLFSIFISSLILIVVSIEEIYEVFKGKEYVEDNIKEYINSEFKIIEDTKVKEEKEVKENIEDTEEIKKGVEIAGQFVEHWKSIASSQTTKEFEQCSMIFWKIFTFLLHNKKIDKINSYTESMALSLLQGESQSCKLRGLLFVNDVYRKAREWIEKKVEEEKKEEKKEYINQPIDLIDKVYDSWYFALCSIDAEITKQTFIESFGEYAHDKYNPPKYRTLKKNNLNVNFYHWFDFFSRNVLYINLFVKHRHDILQERINFLAKILGNYVTEQSRKLYYFDFEYWQKLITDNLNIYGDELFYKMKINVSEEKKDSYYDSIVERNFYICVGYILNGLTKLVIQGWFPEEKIDKVCRYNLLHCMSIHFFMYYIIKNRINEAEIEQIDGVITEKKFIKSLINFYDVHTCIGLENKLLLDIQMEKELEKIPYRFSELYPTVTDGDKLIVWSYFLYVAVTIDMKQHNSKNILADLTQTHDFKNINKKLNKKLNEEIYLKQEFTHLHKYLSENELSDSEAQDLTNRMIAYLDAAKKSKEK